MKGKENLSSISGNLTLFSRVLNLLLSDDRVVDSLVGLITCARFWIRKTVTSRFRESAQCVLDVINLEPELVNEGDVKVLGVLCKS